MVKVVISAALIIIGALFAFWGYVGLLTRPEFNLSGSAAVFESALLAGQLITFPFIGWPLGLERLYEVPWQIELARVLIPTGVLSGMVLALARSFARQRRAVLARFARGHVVVCGLGDDARHLVGDLVSRSRCKVVAVDLDPHMADAEHYHRMHLPVLGMAGRVDDAVLRRAALPRAKAVVALSPSDVANMEIMLAAQRLAANERPPGLRSLVGRARVSEPDVDEAGRLLLGGRAGSLDYRPVSVPRNTVRQLLGRHPLDLDPEVRRGGRVDVVILGFDRIGQELALEIARTAHYADGRTPRIGIVDPEASARVEAFVRRCPGLPEAAELRAVDMNIQANSWDGRPWLDALVSSHPPSRLVICVARSSSGLATAAKLQESARCAGAADLPIYVHLPDVPEFTKALREPPTRATANIVPFGGAAALFTPEIVLEESLDRLARAVHANYLDMLRAAGSPEAMPANRPWEELPETFREANRHQADHIAPKLRAIGCASVPGRAATPFRLRDDEIERLARMEHARWCAERFVSGWRFAPARNDAAREHPSLVPWDALSEAEREKDRAAVRSIPGILERIGHTIRRAE